MTLRERIMGHPKVKALIEDGAEEIAVSLYMSEYGQGDTPTEEAIDRLVDGFQDTYRGCYDDFREWSDEFANDMVIDIYVPASELPYYANKLSAEERQHHANRGRDLIRRYFDYTKFADEIRNECAVLMELGDTEQKKYIFWPIESITTDQTK